jgi:hypothetical protein
VSGEVRHKERESNHIIHDLRAAGWFKFPVKSVHSIGICKYSHVYNVQHLLFLQKRRQTTICTVVLPLDKNQTNHNMYSKGKTKLYACTEARPLIHSLELKYEAGCGTQDWSARQDSKRAKEHCKRR